MPHSGILRAVWKLNYGLLVRSWFAMWSELAHYRQFKACSYHNHRSNSQHTRIRALEHILQLITQQPRLRPYFQDPTIRERLKIVSESPIITSNKSFSEQSFELDLYQMTTFLAKQTLICTEENPLNELVDNLQQTHFFIGKNDLFKCK